MLVLQKELVTVIRLKMFQKPVFFGFYCGFFWMSIVRCCQINIEWETDEQKTFIINLSHYSSCNLMNTALILSLVYYLSISLYLPLNFNTVLLLYVLLPSVIFNKCMYV